MSITTKKYFLDLKLKWFTLLLKSSRWNGISNRSCCVMKFCSRWNFKLLILLSSSYLFCRLRYHGQIAKDVSVFNVSHTDIFPIMLNNKIVKNYTVCVLNGLFIVHSSPSSVFTSLHCRWKAFCFGNKINTVFPAVLHNWLMQIQTTQIHEDKWYT